MKRPGKPDQENEAPTFEQSLAELQSIVESLEDGDLGLAESLARYEQGVAHLRRCYETLSAAEKKIELLTGLDAAGNPITQSFDDASTNESQLASRQRPAKPKRPMADDDFS